MIFYVAINEEGHKQLRGTQADARQVNPTFEQIDIPTDKANLMAFVQDLFDQVKVTKGSSDGKDCPAQVDPTVSLDISHTPIATPSYTEQSVHIDKLFEDLPIAHQLTLAALAMENARRLC